MALQNHVPSSSIMVSSLDLILHISTVQNLIILQNRLPTADGLAGQCWLSRTYGGAHHRDTGLDRCFHLVGCVSAGVSTCGHIHRAVRCSSTIRHLVSLLFNCSPPTQPLPQLLSFAGVAVLFGSAALLYTLTAMLILVSWNQLVPTPSPDPLTCRRDTLEARFSHRTSYGSADDARSPLQRTKIASVTFSLNDSDIALAEEAKHEGGEAGRDGVITGTTSGTDLPSGVGGGGSGEEDGSAREELANTSPGIQRHSPNRRRSLVESVHMKNVPSFPTPLSVRTIKHRSESTSFDDGE